MRHVITIKTIALKGHALQHIRQQAEDQDQGVVDRDDDRSQPLEVL